MMVQLSLRRLAGIDGAKASKGSTLSQLEESMTIGPFVVKEMSMTLFYVQRTVFIYGIPVRSGDSHESRHAFI